MIILKDSILDAFSSAIDECSHDYKSFQECSDSKLLFVMSSFMYSFLSSSEDLLPFEDCVKQPEVFEKIEIVTVEDAKDFCCFLFQQQAKHDLKIQKLVLFFPSDLLIDYLGAGNSFLFGKKLVQMLEYLKQSSIPFSIYEMAYDRMVFGRLVKSVMLHAKKEISLFALEDQRCTTPDLNDLAH